MDKVATNGLDYADAERKCYAKLAVMMELETLRHRIDLLIERLESATNTGNSHTRNNTIYYLRRSMEALEEGEPQVWVGGVPNIRFVADIDGLTEMADDADKYLEMLARRTA